MKCHVCKGTGEVYSYKKGTVVCKNCLGRKYIVNKHRKKGKRN